MPSTDFPQPTLARGELPTVAPALERHAQETLSGKLWRRADLSPRDRSIVTLSALIARNQAIELPTYLNVALDSGVAPSEVSEVSPISLSTPGGATPRPQSRPRRTSSHGAGLAPTSCLRLSPNSCRSTRQRRRSAQPAWGRMWARWRPV